MNSGSTTPTQLLAYPPDLLRRTFRLAELAHTGRALMSIWFSVILQNTAIKP